MRRDEADAAYLWDMLTYAKEIRRRLAGVNFKDYAADADKRLATERRLEIIGRGPYRKCRGEGLPPPGVENGRILPRKDSNLD